MKVLIGLILVLMAGGALATEFVPLEGGVTWTYEPQEPVTGTRIHAMSGPVMWHRQYGFSRVEIENGVPLATTHWAHDDQDRVVLQGVDWGSPAAGGTWFFDPAPVFVDHSLQPDGSLTTTAGLWEVTGSGYQWYGERLVTITCTDFYALGLPDFGSIIALEQTVSWPDSPEPAPWAYGRHDVRTYGLHYGLARIASTLNPDVVWDLVDVDGLTAADLPAAEVGASLTAAPTPFNPTTVFEVRMPATGRARLEVFDLRGRRVEVLRDEVLDAGRHEIAWQPRNLASGMYVARLSAGAAAVTTRVTLLE